QARRRARRVRSVLRKVGDPLSIRRELRSPSIHCRKLGLAGPIDGLYVDSAPVLLGTISDPPVIRREIGIGFVELAGSKPHWTARIDGTGPDGESSIAFPIRCVSYQLAVMRDRRREVKTFV